MSHGFKYYVKFYRECMVSLALLLPGNLAAFKSQHLLQQLLHPIELKIDWLLSFTSSLNVCGQYVHIAWFSLCNVACKWAKCKHWCQHAKVWTYPAWNVMFCKEVFISRCVTVVPCLCLKCKSSKNKWCFLMAVQMPIQYVLPQLKVKLMNGLLIAVAEGRTHSGHIFFKVDCWHGNRFSSDRRLKYFHNYFWLAKNEELCF